MPDAPSPAQESTIEARSRRWLTFVVVLISVCGVVALGVTAIAVRSTGTNDPFEKIKYVSATILPLLASWVGTILAFYFSKESLMAATQSVTDLSKTLTGLDKLKSISVREKMRPLGAITFDQVAKGGESKLKLSDLLKRYSGMERIIILDEGKAVRFLIYRSMIERYLSRILTDPNLLPQGGLQAADLTLQHLLESDADTRTLFETSFGFVKEDATLADAKQVMDKIPKCQDVFVTATGARNVPLIEWVTNNTILENAKL
jgi:hypothetical protein